MQKKKSLLEEVDKTWKLAKLINEANAAPVAAGQAQAQPAPAQTQTQGQRAPQQNPAPQQAGQNQAQMNPQQVQKNIQTAMDQGMADLVKNLPTILQNFTASAGDKDRQLDLPGQPAQPAQNKQAQPAQNTQAQAQPQAQAKAQVAEGRELKFDEKKFRSHIEDELNEGGILGLVASAPAIMQLGGKFIGWTGRKTNTQLLQKWGKNIADAGHSLHHKYIGALEKVVAPFMKGQSKEAVHQAAEAMFMTLVAGLFAGGLAAPDALTGVKGQELAGYFKKMAPKALGALGFA
jgi:hypothetical protein